MQRSFVIEEFPAPLGFRIASLAFGIPAVGLGLLALVLGGIAVFRATFADAPWPPHFALIMAVFLLSGALGVLFIRIFIDPVKTLTIDAATQEARLTLLYPFGIRRKEVFPLAEMDPPEVTWQRDSDNSENGYWQLAVTLPNGRVVKRTPDNVKAVDQKQQADAWEAEIHALRR